MPRQKTQEENFKLLREVGASFKRADDVTAVTYTDPKDEEKSKKKIKALKACEKIDVGFYALEAANATELGEVPKLFDRDAQVQDPGSLQESFRDLEDADKVCQGLQIAQHQQLRKLTGECLDTLYGNDDKTTGKMIQLREPLETEGSGVRTIPPPPVDRLDGPRFRSELFREKNLWECLHIEDEGHIPEGFLLFDPYELADGPLTEEAFLKNPVYSDAINRLREETKRLATEARPSDTGATEGGPVGAGATEGGPVEAGAAEGGVVIGGPVGAGATEEGPVGAGAAEGGVVIGGPVGAGDTEEGPLGAGAAEGGVVIGEPFGAGTLRATEEGPVEAGAAEGGVVIGGPVGAGTTEEGPVGAGAAEGGVVIGGPVGAGATEEGPLGSGAAEGGAVAVGAAEGGPDAPQPPVEAATPNLAELLRRRLREGPAYIDHEDLLARLLEGDRLRARRPRPVRREEPEESDSEEEEEIGHRPRRPTQKQLTLLDSQEQKIPPFRRRQEAAPPAWHVPVPKGFVYPDQADPFTAIFGIPLPPPRDRIAEMQINVLVQKPMAQELEVLRQPVRLALDVNLMTKSILSTVGHISLVPDGESKTQSKTQSGAPPGTTIEVPVDPQMQDPIDPQAVPDLQALLNEPVSLPSASALDALIASVGDIAIWDGSVAPDGVARGGVAPGFVAPDGVAPGVVAPDGVAPGGVVPDGVAPDGVARDGVAPGGVVPDASGEGVRQPAEGATGEGLPRSPPLPPPVLLPGDRGDEPPVVQQNPLPPPQPEGAPGPAEKQGQRRSRYHMEDVEKEHLEDEEEVTDGVFKKIMRRLERLWAAKPNRVVEFETHLCRPGYVYADTAYIWFEALNQMEENGLLRTEQEDMNSPLYIFPVVVPPDGQRRPVATTGPQSVGDADEARSFSVSPVYERESLGTSSSSSAPGSTKRRPTDEPGENAAAGSSPSKRRQYDVDVASVELNAARGPVQSSESSGTYSVFVERFKRKRKE